MIDSLSRWMEERFMPALSWIVDNRYLRAIRDAFITFALPMILVGSFFLILAFPPIPAQANGGWLASINNWAAYYRPVLLVPFQLSFGLLSVLVSFGVAYNLAESYELEGLRIGITALVAFLIASVPVGVPGPTSPLPLGDYPLSSFLGALGGEGLFVAIFLGIFTAEINRFFVKTGLTIKLPEGVPPKVARSFEALLPAFSAISLVWLSEWYISSHFQARVLDPNTLTYTDVPATWSRLIMELLRPLVRASNSYPSSLLQIVLMMVFWSVGIHGMNLVSAVAYPFWTQNLSENVLAAARGLPLPNIVTEPFYHIYAHLGGSGATLPLVFMLLRSRSAQLRQVGRVALLPGIFNINEPVTFGVPIAYNPIMIIPFILAPATIVSVNYLAMATGWVARPIAQIPFTVPVIIGGFFSNRSLSGAFLQVVDLAIAALIYYPFFRAWERRLLRESDE